MVDSARTKSRSIPIAYSMIVILTLAALLLVLTNLITLRLFQEQQSINAKVERQLYYEKLMREYYVYRDSTATGHTTDKSKFYRWDEIEKYNQEKHQSTLVQ